MFQTNRIFAQDDRATVLINAAKNAYDAEDFLKAKDLYLEAISYKLEQKDPIFFEAQCLLGLGQTYNYLNDFHNAIDNFWKAMAIYEKRNNDEQSIQKCLSCYNNIGYSYTKLAEAEINDSIKDSLYEKALGFYEQIYEAQILIGNKQESAVAFYNMGYVCLEKGEIGEAKFYFRKSEGLFHEGDNQEGIAQIYFTISDYCYKLGKRNAQKALDVMEKKYPKDHPVYVKAKVKLGRFK